ncbi:MAG: DUF2240 family protein [Candidatus Aenigmatarchaeota archaeon]
MEDIIQKIISSTGMERVEVEKRIEGKQVELSGLVSKEGAAYIVAKELGLDLVKAMRKSIEIGKIAPKLTNISIKGRIVRIFEPREFESKGRKGFVASMILADASGRIRLTLWDQQVDVLQSLEPGLAIEIFGAYTRENNRGETELRIGRRGGIMVLEDSDLPSMEELDRKRQEPERAKISEMKEGGFYEIKAVVVQLFETEIFYEVCPTCGARTKPENGKFTCSKHGEITPAYAFVVSGVIDDGSENIRAVFFREAGAKVLGMSTEEVVAKKGHLFEDVDVLGKEFIFRGRIRRNKMFGRTEFIVNDIQEVDLKKEIELQINAFGSNL